MKTVSSIADLRSQLAEWRRNGDRIGFVPTMGNLHAGHMSLLAAARYRAASNVGRVFVNTLHFGPNEDYQTYPRTPDEDAKLLEDARCDLLFLPEVEEIYPHGATQQTLIHVRGLSETLCGEFRPGHFEGVATVVAKLFNIVQPEVAVFGEKDFQQYTIIRRMTQDLCMPVEVVGAATVRTADGLAMSSRNRYLSADERARAPRIHAALREAVERIDAGDADYAAIEAAGVATLTAAGMKPDYFSVRDAQTLGAPTSGSRDLVVLTAARVGRARLIDNLRATRR
ncbi:MAG: pantoate--beta-alanine ligase [Steroidobacteraceae bacterium]